MNFSSDYFSINQTLERSLQTAYKLLQSFATVEDFTIKMRLAFGDRFDAEVVNKMGTDWSRKDFTALPKIEICSTQEINGAVGAFAKATNTIYLSQEYLVANGDDLEAIATVLLEEVGHYVDARINDFEAPGDEGAIFSSLVRGKSLSEQELQQLKAENDFATIILDRQTIEIEQATFTGTNSNDTLPASGADNSGDDTLAPLLGQDDVDGGAGNDLLVVDYSANTFTGTTDYTPGINSDVSWNGTGEFSGSFYVYKDSSGQSDSVNFDNIEKFQITGTDSADSLLGGTGNDTLNGGAGNDSINGRGGTDNINGGTGTDTLLDADISGATTGLAINNSGASITLSNGTIVTGVELFGILTTGSGNDSVSFTGANDDAVYTKSGNDTINAGLGQDSVDGGAGNDLLVVDYSANAFTGTTDYSPGINSDVNWNRVGGLYGSFSAYKDGTGQSDAVYFNNIDKLQITGTNSADSLFGGAGNDTLNGGAGNDLINGGGGTDSINGGTGTDILIDADISSATTGLAIKNSGTTISLSNGTTITEVELFNKLTTGSGNDSIAFTTVHDEEIYTEGGNDTINSGFGRDYVDAGTGTDVLVVDYSANTFAGTTDYTPGMRVNFDWNEAGILYGSLSAYKDSSGRYDGVYFVNVEKFQITGTSAADSLDGAAGNDTLNGVGGNDTINGWGGHDTLDGGAGTDTLIGGDGNDAYIVASTTDTISETATGGIDTVFAAVSYTLGTDLENLTLTGTATSATGNSFNNIITGNSVNNILNGGNGVDTLIGGDGNDTYNVDTTGDTITETATGGTDTVVSVVSYILGATTENLTLTGTDAINGTGNSLNNTITGNNAVNTLNGGAGTDTLVGGNGNDTYIVDNTGDTISETASGGNDTVSVFVSYTLATNVENLMLAGAVIDGTGNSLNNTLTGNNANNTLDGNSGNDTLNGGAGIDTLIGDDGNDIYIVDSTTDAIAETTTGGIDTVQSAVSYTLGATSNLENLTLTGTAAINGTGNTLNNAIAGNVANNTLTGGDGVDTLIGGDGNDSYILDSTTDAITETTTGGIDTVQSAVSYTLGATSNLENLTLTGTTDINGTGNALNNVLTGNSGANTLNGGAGIDTLIGGVGNDIYIVDSTGDAIAETNSGGIDTVQSAVSYTLSATSNLENLTLTGTAAINGTGNTLNNVLTGNAANNTFTGGDGVDTLIGGDGNDIYILDSTTDAIAETNSGGSDTVQSAVSYTLGATSNLENLTLTGTAAINGTGNTLNNTIAGNSANNILDGGAGTDTLIGSSGNDTYIVDSTTDTISDPTNGGIDTVQSAVSYTLGATSNLENLTLTGTATINGTGNTLNNVLSGNGADNTLTGGNGVDTLIGGDGNDTYILDSTTDTISETALGGIDTVQSAVSHTLSATSNLENLTLTGTAAINGTGNSLDNVLTGNAANNTLIGGDGVDTLIGGDGNDSYILDSTTDAIAETTSGGSDTVQSAVSYTLGATSNLENLTLTGTAAINGTGNTLNNVLTGNSINNTLDGGAGIDTLSGGSGDDTYILDSTTDTISDPTTGGIDTVQSAISYALGATSNLENLTLTGTAAINGTGNTLNNTITGNSTNNTLTGGDGVDTLTGEAGDDTLLGGLGNDSLTGGVGSDRFTFNTSTERVDTITDFVAVDDIISVSAAGFGGGLVAGAAITTAQLLSGAGTTTATDANVRFIYNTTNGALFYDADGNGTGAAVQIAILTGTPSMTNADIFVTM